MGDLIYYDIKKHNADEISLLYLSKGMIMGYDFSGYATKNDLKCADGRIIRHDAFKENDGKIVPLVWQHVHDDPTNVLGHALLENRDDGVYAYGTFNKTPSGEHAREMVKNGDISSLSIFANRLQQNGSDVVHGIIREVSLVMAGANPGALIDNISFAHADGSTVVSDEEAVIFSGVEGLDYEEISHSIEEEGSDVANENLSSDEVEKLRDMLLSHEDSQEDKTVQDVIDSMTEEQKKVMYYIVGQALNDSDDLDNDDDDNDEGNNTMKHNVFDGSIEDTEDVLSHDELNAILADATRSSSLKDTFLEHGVENLEILFPEAKALRPTPDMVTREMAWVSEFWAALHKSPFSRVKSVYTDGLTLDEARAKGYVKGNKKVEEQFGLLHREVSPQTVYKKQKLDRDDIIDITDIDIVAWLKQEMRMMLNEELCRAVLVGDGRDPNATDKIREEHIQPIYTDADVYTIHYNVEYAAGADDNDKSATLVDSAILARKDYKGSGNPVLYATNEIITQMLLARDKIGRRMYKDEAELASALRVRKVVEVPIMEGVTRTVTEGEAAGTYDLLAVIVNPADYTIGADKGGAVSLFDDFDIDYNQMKYLIETRCSGALTKPYSAIALEQKQGSDTNSTPASNEGTGD